MVAANSFPIDDEKLREFEDLFRNRYTEHDRDYKKAMQEGQRLMLNVPIMNQWPPRIYAGKNKFSRGRDRSRRQNRGDSGLYYSRKDYNDLDQSRFRPYTDFRDQDNSMSEKPGISEDHLDDQTHHMTDKDHNHSFQTPLDHFKDSPSKPLTEKECEDILSSAHFSNIDASHVEHPRKKQSRKTSKAKKSKQTSTTIAVHRIPLLKSHKVDKDIVNTSEETSTSAILSELQTHDVHVDDTPRNQRKRKHSMEDESDPENEHIDVEGGYMSPLPVPEIIPDNDRQPFYASTSERESLVVSVPRTPVKESGMKHKKRKKHKHKKERNTDD